MSNQNRLTEIKYLGRYLDGKWLLNLYLLKHNQSEYFSDETINDIINKSLLQLETECMSKEFNYFKIGFAFLHFGERGVALNIWHIGLWHSTYEIFCCNWYCYNRNITNMELLENAEPRICHYEIPIATKEFDNIRNIVATISSENEFETGFINSYKEN